MRKFMMGMLLAASAATPLAAQTPPDAGVVLTPRYAQLGERNAARAERREQRQADRGNVAQRQAFEQRQQRNVAAGQAATVRPGVDRQALLDARRDARVDQRGGDRREALRDRIEASRESSRESARGLPANYQRQAARNQQRYEERLREDFRERREVRQDRRDYRQDRRADRRDYRNWQRDWNRGWRNDRRYNWQGLRTANRYLFSPGRYYAPYRGYNYQRFSVGFVLDPLFFSDRYQLSDPYQYRLPPAYAGTQWVRYFDDVLLVDTYTGEVIDVIHDFFW